MSKNRVTPMQIERNISIALSYLRVAALISIVSCHFLQAYDNDWAWILNIGVQVFFFISGYLYGHRGILNWIDWYKRRLIRVYLPFLLTTFTFIVVFLFFAPENISFSRVVSHAAATQWFFGSISGLNHLWFITAILICYLATPLLQSLKPVGWQSLVVLTGYALFEIIIVRYDVELFLPVFIYSSGYMYANLNRSWRRCYIFAMCVLCSIILWKSSWALILDYHSMMNQLFHSFLGIAISLVFIELGSSMVYASSNKIISLLDKYSYEIYLVHHPFIIGPLSCVALTDSRSFNILLILLIISVVSFFLKVAQQYLSRYICERSYFIL